VPEPATQTFSATSWNKVVAVLNYSTETYNVFVNDAAYLTDVPFKTSGVSALNGFKSFSASASNIDLVGFFFSEDGDFDGDGIADDVDPDPLVAAPQEPEVEVAVVGGAAITDGGGPVDFGTETEGTTPATIVFEVSNTGNAELTTSNLDVPGGFTIVGQLAASIPAGSSDTFSVSLDTSIVGTFNGDILFDNNDADENPFNLSVTGTVEADTPAWGRAQGDFNGDGCTNLTDFLFLASNWMQDPDGAGPEAPITLTDFLALASNWMQGPNC
jgi:hypothetical protein